MKFTREGLNEAAKVLNQRKILEAFHMITLEDIETLGKHPNKSYSIEVNDNGEERVLRLNLDDQWFQETYYVQLKEVDSTTKEYNEDSPKEMSYAVYHMSDDGRVTLLNEITDVSYDLEYHVRKTIKRHMENKG